MAYQRKDTISNRKLDSTIPFRFLELPPEIRRNIYDVWMPSVLHVSLGGKGIRLQHFTETSGGLHLQAFSIRPFFLNKQAYQEICHALFTGSTWYFSSTDLLLLVFARLPKSTRDLIRHVSMRLTSPCDEVESNPAWEFSDHMAIYPFQPAQRCLRQMGQLKTLVINMNFADFCSRRDDPVTRCLAHSDGEANKLAANCVADFTWEGLVTKIPFVASNLSSEFLDTLKQRCGEANVRCVLKHKDRYAGQMVDVVISQCIMLDEKRP